MSDAVAAKLDDLAAVRAAEPAADGKPGRPGKPEGVIDLSWGHGGNRIELCWESRPTVQVRRISGLHDDTDRDALAAVFADAGLNVEVAPAHHEGNPLPMAGTFDLTFAADSKPPTELLVADAAGNQVAIKLARVPLIKPDPAPSDPWYPPPPAGPTAAAPAVAPRYSYGYSPLAMTYAAVAATPGEATKPAAHGAAKVAAPGRAPPGKAAAQGGIANATKRKRPEAAAKMATAQRSQQKATPSVPMVALSRGRLPNPLDMCSHCGKQGHARAMCPNINAMDWTKPADPPAGAVDLPLTMETEAAAPSDGEQGPPAAVTASSRPDGPSA